jgi:hypothetical protein
LGEGELVVKGKLAVAAGDAISFSNCSLFDNNPLLFVIPRSRLACGKSREE